MFCRQYSYIMEIQHSFNVLIPQDVYYARIFEVQNWALFTKVKKNGILSDSKRSGFITDFELVFDTATLIILCFRMTNARVCKQSFKYDLFYRMYLPYIKEKKERGHQGRPKQNPLGEKIVLQKNAKKNVKQKKGNDSHTKPTRKKAKRRVRLKPMQGSKKKQHYLLTCGKLKTKSRNDGSRGSNRCSACPESISLPLSQ